MFAALGVKVTLIEARDQLLPFLDREMGERLRAAMTHLGVMPHLDDERRGGARATPDGRLDVPAEDRRADADVREAPRRGGPQREHRRI